MINLPYIFSQRDPRWKNVDLGFSKESIGEYGCLITCLSMIASLGEEKEINPYAMNNELKNVKGFLGSYYKWGAYPRVYEDAKETMIRVSGTISQQNFNGIKGAIDDGVPVMVCIDFNPYTSALETHYVVVIDVIGDDFKIADPWTGEIGMLSAVYKKKPMGTVVQYAVYSISKQVDYLAEWVSQERIEVNGEEVEEVVIKSKGRKPISDLQLYYRIDPNISNPSNWKVGQNVIQIKAYQGLYRALIPINPITINPKGTYRVDYGLALNAGGEWQSPSFNCFVQKRFE